MIEYCSTRIIYPRCGTLSEVHTQLWRDIKNRQRTGPAVEADNGALSTSCSQGASHGTPDAQIDSDSACDATISVDPIAAAMGTVAAMPRFTNIGKNPAEQSVPSHISIRRAQATDAGEMLRCAPLVLLDMSCIM